MLLPVSEWWGRKLGQDGSWPAAAPPTSSLLPVPVQLQQVHHSVYHIHVNSNTNVQQLQELRLNPVRLWDTRPPTAHNKVSVSQFVFKFSLYKSHNSYLSSCIHLLLFIILYRFCIHYQELMILLYRCFLSLFFPELILLTWMFGQSIPFGIYFCFWKCIELLSRLVITF